MSTYKPPIAWLPCYFVLQLNLVVRELTKYLLYFKL